jgi:hypothetical protein
MISFELFSLKYYKIIQDDMTLFKVTSLIHNWIHYEIFGAKISNKCFLSHFRHVKSNI